MGDYQTLFKEGFYFANPQDFYSIAGMAIFVLILLIFLRKNWESLSLSLQRDWVLYAVLAAVSPLLILIGGFKIGSSAIPLPNLPGEMPVALFIPLAAISWQLASGILGIGPAFVLGIISGIVLGGFHTHSYFTILEFAGMALLFAYFVRQKFRSPFYHVLRIPLIAAIITVLLFFPILTITQFLNIGGSLAVRLEYGFSQALSFSIARSFELIFGGLLVSILYGTKSGLWKFPQTLEPSPIEQKIENRFLLSVFPFIIIVILVLIVSDWRLAGGAARDVIEERLRNTAETTAASIPFFMEAGQNLARSMAKEDLLTHSEDTEKVLAEKLHTTPFFSQLFLFDVDGKPVGGYPIKQLDALSLSSEELAGIELARQGVETQTYTNYTQFSENSVKISFLAAIKNGEEGTSGVLLARTDFNTNPFTFPSLRALQKITNEGGVGLILDKNGRIIFNTSSNENNLQVNYQGFLPDQKGTFESYSPQSIRQIVYYQPIVGSTWSVLVSIPAQQSYELALQIAGPLLLFLSVILILVFILLRLSMRPITSTLRTLSAQASLIAQGNLENPVTLKSEDEFGQLANSFELMRVRLKGRLDELNQLLISSQAIGQNLDINQSLQILLQAALSSGAKYARVVLVKEVVTDHIEKPFLAIGLGGDQDAIQALDQQLFENMKTHEKLVIPNLARMRRLLPSGSSIAPAALLAIALQRENQYYGVLWVGYEETRLIPEEEIRFISMLANQAAMAAANAKLYATAELGRQRLEAVLTSTPEPVMVFDEDNRLLLINAAACQLRSLVNSTTPGQSMSEVVSNKELYELLINVNENKDSTREIKLSNERTYYISVSVVNYDQRIVGKVCLLRDITNFRELDAVKSDVVSSVSHDLRTPLTFIKGYATMMQMVGELNEQQREYVGKIVSGIEDMTKKVNDHLDISRIESGVRLKIEQVSPVLIVEQVVNLLQPVALQKNIEISIDADGIGDLAIEADVEMLNQAVFNLVENAIKFTPMAGKVGIHLTASEKTILFEIRDTGIGVAPLDRPHIFDKFYRSNRRESYRNHGTGLGLAIVKSIAERHNGQAWVDSKLGRGSSFFLEIPRINSPDVEKSGT